MTEKTFEEWAILELMGHRRLAGLVREQTIGSASFIRIDVFVEGNQAIATQFYNPDAVYCMTPVSEELARQIAKRDQPAPVSRWELPPPPQHSEERPPVDDMDFPEDDYEEDFSPQGKEGESGS